MKFNKKKYIQNQIVIGMIIILGISTLKAQNEVSRIPSVSTNLLSWLLTTPNIGIDIPLSSPYYINASSLYIEGIASLNANKVYVSNMTYKLLSGKVEYRRHFRFGEDMNKCSPLTNAANFIAKWVTSKEYWRKRKLNLIDDKGRSYLGLFAQFADYSFCLPVGNYCEGKNGCATIAGVSLGYNKPLYSFNNKYYLEWEFGTSLGYVFSDFERFNRKESHVVNKGTWKSPMITDLHVSLVLRKHSITNMYKKTMYVDY